MAGEGRGGEDWIGVESRVSVRQLLGPPELAPAGLILSAQFEEPDSSLQLLRKLLAKSFLLVDRDNCPLI